MRYLIIAFSCLIIEIASTMYISSVSSNSPYMLLWAFVGPFLGLPFIGYIIDEKNWSGRFRIAFASAIGYVIGASVIFLIKK